MTNESVSIKILIDTEVDRLRELMTKQLKSLDKKQSQSHNLQIGEVIDAVAQADRDLFDNDKAVLMPVTYNEKNSLTICDRELSQAIRTKNDE